MQFKQPTDITRHMAISISLNYLWMIFITFLMAFSCELQPIFAARAEVKTKVKSEKVNNKKELLIKNHDQWLSEIQSVVKKYNSSSGIKMAVKKKVHMELLGEDKESEGKVLFKKGQINLTFTKPDFSKIIMSSKKVWIVQKQPEAFGGKLLVTVVERPSINKKTKVPLVFLMSDPKVWEQFEIVDSEKQNENLFLALKPKDQQRMPDVMYLKLKLNIEKKIISSLSFTDELDNITVYEFSTIAFNQKISKREFDYTPPSDAEVTNY